MRSNKSVKLTDKITPKLSKTNALFIMLMKLKVKRLSKTLRAKNIACLGSKTSKNGLEVSNRPFSSILCAKDKKNTNNKLNKMLKILKRNKKSNMSDCQTVYKNEIDHVISFDILNGSLEGATCVLCLELFSTWQLGSIICNCCKQYNYCGILNVKNIAPCYQSNKLKIKNYCKCDDFSLSKIVAHYAEPPAKINFHECYLI
jgi:hypothetical protein